MHLQSALAQVHGQLGKVLISCAGNISLENRIHLDCSRRLLSEVGSEDFVAELLQRQPDGHDTAVVGQPGREVDVLTE